jgi:hypothetical protein
MTIDQALTILEVLIGGAAPGVLLHVLGLAAKPWARALLSLIPDLIGAVRRAKGKAGAEGAPNVRVPLPLLLLLTLGCGGHPQLPPEKLALCLTRMNDRLMGRTSCEDIVKAITSVVSEDSACSELLFHGLKCEGPKDGG